MKKANYQWMRQIKWKYNYFETMRFLFLNLVKYVVPTPEVILDLDITSKVI